MRKSMRFIVAGILAVTALPVFAQVGQQTELERRLSAAWSPEQWSDELMLQDVRRGLSGGDRWHFDRMMWQLPGNDTETILMLLRTSYRGGMAYAWETGRAGTPIYRERTTIQDTTIRTDAAGRTGVDTTIRTQDHTMVDQRVRDQWRDAWMRDRADWNADTSWQVVYERMSGAEQARAMFLWDRLTWSERDAIKNAVHNAIRWGGTAHSWRTTPRAGTMTPIR